MKRHISSLFAWAVVSALAATGLGLAACAEDSAVKEVVADAGKRDSAANDGSVTPADGGDGGGRDCFENPQTHVEIINACTTATKVVKNPSLPALLPDGGLPALP
jgi:hypothetical protein